MIPLSTFKDVQRMDKDPARNKCHQAISEHTLISDPVEIQNLLCCRDDDFNNPGTRRPIQHNDSGGSTSKSGSKGSPVHTERPYSVLDQGSPDKALDRLNFSNHRRRNNNHPNLRSPEFSPEVLNMIKKLQTEIDTLREYLDERKRDRDSWIYERIESKGSEKQPGGCKRKLKCLSESLVQHAANRGLHRIRHLFDAEAHCLRRFLWISLFLCCTALFAYQIRDRVTVFLNYATDTKIETQYLPAMAFPAVTVCNLNKYRLIPTARLGLYSSVHNFVHGENRMSRSDMLIELQRADMTYSRFLKNVSHEKHSLIQRCTWQNEPCGPQNFTAVFTDHGLCFTFNIKGKVQPVRKPGPTQGLSLSLNVEQYEYLLGPRSAVGVELAVHDPAEVPRMSGDGLYAAAAAHTSLAVKKVKYMDFPTPESRCTRSDNVYQSQSRRSCQYECEVKRTIRQCECTLPYRTELRGGARACSLADYFVCAKGPSGKGAQLNATCQCDPFCDTVEYEIELSQSAMSSYASESESRLLENREQLEAHFRLARDTYHQLDTDIFNYDISLLKDIADGFKGILSYVNSFNQEMRVHKEGFKNRYETLKKDLLRLNLTVHKTSGDFERSTHVAFLTYVNSLKTALADIVRNKDIANNFHAYNPRQVRWYLGQLLKNLSSLVYTKDSGSSSPSLVEIKKGVVRFREEIVDGYGQSYVEFRNARQFYSLNTRRLENYTDLIADILLAKYKELKNLTHMKDFKHSTVVGILGQFFKTIEHVLHDTFKKLHDVQDIFFNTYIHHKDNITKLYTKLDKIGINVSISSGVIENSLAKLERSIRSLHQCMETLGDDINDIRTGYQNNLFRKTAMVERFNMESTEKALNDAQNILKDIRSDVELVSENGRLLVTTVRPIASRIVDITGTEHVYLKSTLDYLRFSQLKLDVGRIKEGLAGNLSMITGFHAELMDYVEGNKIDGTFYQNNFLHVDIYYQDLSMTTISKHQSYGLVDFACDVGGSLALYLGASILTIFEVIDFIIKAFALMCTVGRKDTLVTIHGTSC